MKRQRVVLDACVLYPPALRDFLLTVAALDGFIPIWSDVILDEVERNVIEDNPTIDPTAFRTHTLASMKRVFPDAAVAPVSESDFDVAGVREGDRHVALTAIASKANAILTINQKHLPKTSLQRHRIAILTLGDLVGSVIDTDPLLVPLALDQLSRRWRNPPQTVGEIIDLLSKHPTMKDPLGSLKHEP